jgi:hypothetical protein
MVTRVPRALVMTALTAPVVLVAHLLTTGAAPPLAAVLAVTLVAFALGAVARVDGAPALAAVIGVAQVAGHGVLALTSAAPAEACLPAVGRGAALGAQVTLFGAEGCPPGTYTGGTLSRAAVAALATAAVLVVTHLVAAAAGGLLVAAVEGCRTVLRAFAALVRPIVPLRLPVTPRLAAFPDHPEPLRLDGTRVPVALTHRGPPRVAF